MDGLLKYNYEDADNTGVAHDNIDEILSRNHEDAMLERYAQSGTIGTPPVMGEEELLNLAMGVSGPGMAIGRVSRAAMNNMMNTVSKPGKAKGAVDKLMQKLNLQSQSKATIRQHLKEGMDLSPESMHGKFASIVFRNKADKARILREKALDKYGMPHEGRKMMDPVSEMLRASRYKKN